MRIHRCSSFLSRMGFGLIVLLLATNLAQADLTPTEAKALAVDVVWLNQGPELRGALLGKEAGGRLLFAVRRDWLAEADPKRLAAEEDVEATRTRQCDEDLLKRIDAWVARHPEGGPLHAALQIEKTHCRERLDAKAPEKTEFLIMELPESEIRRTFAQPAGRRHLAETAWHLRLPKTESSSAVALQKLLDEQFKDWKEFEADLSERLPPLPQDDKEWSARVALWEYSFLQPCDFQGTADFLVRTDSGEQRPDVMSLIGPALESGLKSQLGELLSGDLQAAAAPPKDRWKSQATEEAEEARIDGCRATRIDLDPVKMSGTTASDFLVHLADGQWQSVWSVAMPVDVSTVRPDAVERIRNDPQIKSLQQVFAGLGAAGDLDRALKFGAAVENSQKAIDAQFSKFRDHYTRRLSGPPLRWK